MAVPISSLFMKVNYYMCIQFCPDQFQPAVYKSVVEDVINGVRETFLDEGCDEQILQELKQVQ